MKTILSMLCCALTLTACDQPNRPPSKTVNGDVRTLSAMSTLAGTGNVATMAARACDKEGKKLEVITTTTETGISGKTYPVIMFRCVQP